MVTFIGYFEGIDSQRGIAWRCSDSLSLRRFLGLRQTESTPDHSSLTVIRQRLPKELIEQVFGWMKTIGGLRKLRHCGGELVDWIVTFTAAAYNLVRLRTLLTRPA